MISSENHWYGGGFFASLAAWRKYFSNSLGREGGSTMAGTFFLILTGASYGLLAAAGVFTVLVAVGLVPRFAGRTHTADKVILYE